MSRIFLYGPPGSGKSTVGRVLAEKLDVLFLDLDPVIEQRAGMSIPQIMAEQGEPAFREKESAALKDTIEGSSIVIALGGGALLRETNRMLAESTGTIICLDAGLETMIARLRADANQRPLLAGDLKEKLSSLLEKRREHYQSFRLRFSTEMLEPTQIAWQIQIALGCFRVGGMGQAYDVLVRPDGLDSLGELLQERNLGGPVVVVTETNVGPLYAERMAESLQRVGYKVHVINIPAGEESKTLETVSTLWRSFLQAGLDRKSTVVALGGGVTGDLTGFAASTFMRGVPWVTVPTSMLAMADASLGGKTGFDLPEGKNLVGSFYPPRLVLADPDVLNTLPDVELRSGLAEVVKHGVISDPDLFALCATGFDDVKSDLAIIVRRAMAVKIAVIEADPYERGLRAALNLGHTLGHAVETASGYQLRHGEAVAIGMVAEARLAERLSMASVGLSERIITVLVSLGLPTEIPSGLSRQSIIQTIKLDKKKAAGVVRFALPVDIGKVEVGVAVENLNLLFEK